MPNQRELLQAVTQLIEEREAIGNQETIDLIEDLLTNYSDVINTPECVIPSKQELIKQLSKRMADENNNGHLLAGVTEREAWYFKGEATVAVDFLAQIMVLPVVEFIRRPVNTHPKTDIIANHAKRHGSPCSITAQHIITNGWSRGTDISNTITELRIRGYNWVSQETVYILWKRLTERMVHDRNIEPSTQHSI